jgi:hypothetical protein
MANALERLARAALRGLDRPRLSPGCINALERRRLVAGGHVLTLAGWVRSVPLLQRRDQGAAVRILTEAAWRISAGAAGLLLHQPRQKPS